MKQHCIGNRPLSHSGHFESKKLCFCPSSHALDERLDGQNLLFQHCVQCMNLVWHDRRVSSIFFQVLPLATEVVRWFDMKPLEILWDNYLSRENTLLCYGSCIALRYSILHAGRLMHFLEQPPPSWKVSSLFSTTAFVV